MEPRISRRNFLQTTGAALGTGPLLWSKTAGASPSETVNLAVIGTGSQGKGHVQRFDRLPNCRVVAVCDLDPERLDSARQVPQDAGRVQQYRDYRRLLEDKDIDAVSIATCDHWHTPVALAAILAGKHVYVEKPCSHNIHETNLLVKCAAEHRKCVQHGTQRRSDSKEMAGIRALREGLIGDVLLAKAIDHQLRKKIGRAQEEDPPAGVNYDMWLGAAPKRPFTRNRWHYNWHWFWDYGGGDLVNDGIHQLDEAVWGMGVDEEYPQSIMTSGGQLWYDDDHETPDTQTVVFQYPGKQILFEMRLWTPYGLEGHDNGTVFYGTRGKLEMGRKGPKATVGDKIVEIRAEDYGIESEDIIQNFITAVRHDDPSKLNSPIQTGAVSTNLCHLGNIGTRCGGIQLAYDPELETITSAGRPHHEATQMIRRNYRKGYELAYSG